MICSADSKRKESMKVIQNNSKIKIAEFGTFALESTCVHEERLETGLISAMVLFSSSNRRRMLKDKSTSYSGKSSKEANRTGRK